MLNQVGAEKRIGKARDASRALSDTDRKAVIDGFLNACDAATA